MGVAHVVEARSQVVHPLAFVRSAEAPCRRARQLRVHGDVGVADRVGVGAFGELLAPELAQGLEQAEATALRDEHRLVDEHAEQPDDVALVDAVARGHAFCLLEHERAREHGEAVEEQLLHRCEQVVRPLDQVAERAVARIRGAP